MTAASVTARGRTAAEALMADACTVTRVTPGSTFNTTTGAYTGGSTATIYTGACRVKPRDNADRVVQFGEEAVAFWPFIVSIPMSEDDVDLDDLVTITASALDPALVGLVLRVRQVQSGSQITARRLSCERNAG